jgi:hypothetical protein
VISAAASAQGCLPGHTHTHTLTSFIIMIIIKHTLVSATILQAAGPGPQSYRAGRLVKHPGLLRLAGRRKNCSTPSPSRDVFGIQGILRKHAVRTMHCTAPHLSKVRRTQKCASAPHIADDCESDCRLEIVRLRRAFRVTGHANLKPVIP